VCIYTFIQISESRGSICVCVACVAESARRDKREARGAAARTLIHLRAATLYSRPAKRVERARLAGWLRVAGRRRQKVSLRQGRATLAEGWSGGGGGGEESSGQTGARLHAKSSPDVNKLTQSGEYYSQLHTPPPSPLARQQTDIIEISPISRARSDSLEMPLCPFLSAHVCVSRSMRKTSPA
jgi:hypothetical protein